MTKIDTVTIHHPGILAESEVPPESVHSWLQQGWLEGPFPRSDNRPPKKGKGSDKAAWQTYAQSIGIDTDRATRDEIIAAVDAFDDAPPSTIASRQPDDDDSLEETTTITPPLGNTPKEGQS